MPAGTGVLDLASIYDAHIAGLTRGEIDERGRTIRDEAYQLFVAIAFVTLLAGVLLVGGRPQRRGPAASVLAAFLLTTTSTPEAFAQAREPEAVVEETAPVPVETPELDPRARFNRAQTLRWRSADATRASSSGTRSLRTRSSSLLAVAQIRFVARGSA